MAKYMQCPETPDSLTGNVFCDTYGYCPHGNLCMQVYDENVESDIERIEEEDEV